MFSDVNERNAGREDRNKYRHILIFVLTRDAEAVDFDAASVVAVMNVKLSFSKLQ